MKRFIGGAAMAVALFLATTAGAQYPPPPPPPGAVQLLYQAPQLDQMLAAIALYPDPLLTTMLTAATYPLEIVDADRWLALPGNAALGDGALAAALEGQNWDPSVKSLVAFPQILRMMDARLDWTQAIGNAFLAQQADVMDSIQRLRHAALAAGTLASNPDIIVTADGPYIEIEPARPQFVAVPVYNPMVVYGAWPYPAYPPIYYGPPPGLGISVTYGGIGFGVAIGVVDVLWNWGHWDWRDHDIRVNPSRFNRIDAGHPPIRATVWQHDPAHRRGVPYADPRSRARYERALPGSPAERRDYRGYPAAPQPAPQRPGAARRAAPPQRPPAPAMGVQPRREAPQPSPRVTPQQAPPSATRPAPRVTQPAPQPAPQRPGAARPAAPPPRPRAPATGVQPRREAPQPRVTPQQAPPSAARVAPRVTQPAPQRSPTAFQDLSRGPEARALSQRGQASRQSPPPPSRAPASRAPVARPQRPQAPERRP